MSNNNLLTRQTLKPQCLYRLDKVEETKPH